MVKLKYLTATICLIFAAGELLPVYLIGFGLLTGAVPQAQVTYFAAKLAVHLCLLGLLGYAAYWLWRSAKAASVPAPRS